MRSARSALVITHVFPPVNAVGAHRTVALCRCLVQQGWHVTVVTGRPTGEYPLDTGLLARMPVQICVVRTACPHLLNLAARWLGRGSDRKKPAAAPDDGAPQGTPSSRPGAMRRAVGWLSWWLCVPDGNVGWFVPGVWAGLCEAARHRPDVVYSSGPVWTSHLLGAALSRLLRLPFVADFRDPWCGSAWHKVPHASHRWVDDALERLVVQRATRVTCAWDGIRKHLAARYPERAGRFLTILNGFDAEGIDNVGAERVEEGRCVMLHSGTFYGLRSPSPLLEGLRRFRDEAPREAARLLVVLLGRTDYNGRPLEALARDYGVVDLVRVMSPTSHERALAYLKGADVAVLFGQGGKDGTLAPVPAKTYEYVGLEKSVLAVAAGGEALEVLCRGGCRVWSVGGDDPREVAAALREIVREQGRARPAAPSVGTGRSAFTRGRMAERLAAVLGDVIRRGRCRGPSVGPRGNPEHVGACASAPAGDQAGRPRPEDDGGRPGPEDKGTALKQGRLNRCH